MTERQHVLKIRDEAEKLGYLFLIFYDDKREKRNPQPLDFIITFPCGRSCVVEAKMENKILTPKQHKFGMFCRNQYLHLILRIREHGEQTITYDFFYLDEAGEEIWINTRQNYCDLIRFLKAYIQEYYSIKQVA